MNQTQGLTYNEVRNMRDYLKKANMLQVRWLYESIKLELDWRVMTDRRGKVEEMLNYKRVEDFI